MMDMGRDVGKGNLPQTETMKKIILGIRIRRTRPFPEEVKCNTER